MDRMTARRANKRRWHHDAKCRDMDPQLFDMAHFNKCTDDDRRRAAAVLCRDCPVMAECAADALVPLAIGTVRAGVWLPEQHDSRRRERVAKLRRIAAGVDRG